MKCENCHGHGDNAHGEHCPVCYHPTFGYRYGVGQVPIVYTCIDHPQANERTPVKGEVGWDIRFPIENGETVILRIGEKGRKHLLEAIEADKVVPDEFRSINRTV